MTSTDWIAVYAAIVATGALALEVRRWFESGPRLTVQAKANMMMIDNLGKQENGLTVATVTNRGDAPTTITSLGIVEYPSYWARLRNRTTREFLVVHPSDSHPLPYVLAPGTHWIGIARKRPDLYGDIQTGTMWVAIGTTNRGKPYLARIPKRKPRPELENATKV